MYSHRDEKKRVDVVDLDPYGTAAPFIDAAVQCVKDNGQHHDSIKSGFGGRYFYNRPPLRDLHRPFRSRHHKLPRKMVSHLIYFSMCLHIYLPVQLRQLRWSTFEGRILP